MRIDTDDPEDGRRQAVFAAIREKIGGVFARISDAQMRAEAEHQLQALSDEDLQEMGIARDDIHDYVHHNNETD